MAKAEMDRPDEIALTIHESFRNQNFVPEWRWTTAKYRTAIIRAAAAVRRVMEKEKPL